MTTTANWSVEMDNKLAQMKSDPVDYYAKARRRARSKSRIGFSYVIREGRKGTTPTSK